TFECFLCFFFFSSRRRHTRWPRDWSSDVCSSDLHTRDRAARGMPVADHERVRRRAYPLRPDRAYAHPNDQACGSKRHQAEWASRSEERRVGKEGGFALVAEARKKKCRQKQRDSNE